MAKPWGVIPLFGIATCFLYWFSLQAPKADDDDDDQIVLTFPSDMESLRAVAKALQMYSSRNWTYVFILFSLAYTYKQAFCIPGSGILNILAGALYGMPGGLVFVCVFTAFGASLAFYISRTFYKDILKQWFPERFRTFEAKIEENRHRLLFFMVFIRVVPVSPGWAINLVSPLLNVPISIFFVTTLLGLIPYNYLGVSAGGMLVSLSSVNDIFTLKSFLTLLIMAVVVVGPSFIMKSEKEKRRTV